MKTGFKYKTRILQFFYLHKIWDSALYDFSFKFIRSIHCEKWVANLCLLPDGSFLCFTPSFVYNAPNGIWQMSSEGIGIRCPVRNEFYRYKDTGISCVMKWNVKARTALDFPGIESCVSIKESFWTCPIFIDADEWVFGIWGEYNVARSQLFILYSKREKKTFVSHSLVVDMGNLSSIANPVSSNLPNAMVGIVDEDLIMSSKSFKLDQTDFFPDDQTFLLIYCFQKK